MLVIVVKEWISTKKALLTKQDIRNIKVKVDDRIIKRHEDDASSVFVMVAELQQESYTPILFSNHTGKWIVTRTSICFCHSNGVPEGIISKACCHNHVY